MFVKLIRKKHRRAKDTRSRIQKTRVLVSVLLLTNIYNRGKKILSLLGLFVTRSVK